MSESVWFEQVDIALVDLLRKIIHIDGKPVKVVVRKPDEDFSEEDYPLVSIYNLYDRFSKERYSPDAVIAGRDYSSNMIIMEDSAVPYDLFYQIDFWSTLQTDMNTMTKQWKSYSKSWFNLDVVDESSTLRSCFVLSRNDFNKSDLIIIGARPGMGKTSFALNLARNIAVVGSKKVIMFSLEMTKAQLAERVLATEARVDVKKMRSGEFDDNDWQRIGVAVGSLANCNLYFDDTSTITVPEMKARIRRMRDVDAVVVDYLGLLKSDKNFEGQRVQEVSDITRNLKLMAKDLNIPVVACSQLARVTEGRGKSHKPMLSDLRDSGSIEQDADIVLMLYRPFYYINEKDGPLTEEDLAKKNEAELIIAKNRHGPLESVPLHWNGAFTLFSNAEKTRNEP